VIPNNKEAWRKRYLAHFVDYTPGENSTTPHYWSLSKLAEDFQFNLDDQPFIIKLFLENVMRHFSSHENIVDTIDNLIARKRSNNFEFSYFPSRVLMQDYTGVPALVDLAAMRDAITEQGGNAKKVNPHCPVDLVIDHSVIADQSGNSDALVYNRQREMERNQERYQFLKWAQGSFDNLTVVPPGRGICHQVNLEYLAQVVREEAGVLIPDTLIGTDSHTTMINGLGVLGWGVGGIEAEAAMLGQPLSLGAPTIVGVQLQGSLPVGVTATDLVLTITQILREYGVVGKYVEFYGSGMLALSIAERATVANMAPEYGATCGLFPIDNKVIDYLKLTNRSSKLVERVKIYPTVQQLWHDQNTNNPIYPENITIDLNQIAPCVAGPKRPQDRVALNAIKQRTLEVMTLNLYPVPKSHQSSKSQSLANGDIVIAAITSCTNTSNPKVMLQAGLLAKAAVQLGLTVKNYVKTSLAPGSQVVARYFDSSGLQPFLDQLGFHRIGFGCTTCIGNSGPLKTNVELTISENNLSVGAVLSGNRNFEGRIHPAVQLNWLASPPLVVAFALVGHTRIDFDNEPLGIDKNGQEVFLQDIWPSDDVVNQALSSITQESYASSYKNMLVGDKAWESLPITNSVCYPWNDRSTYIVKPPFLEVLPKGVDEGSRDVYRKKESLIIKSANILAILGDSITTDHISPAGKISQDSPAGKYLSAQGISPEQFNSYGARRGHHEVMVRGTFSNIRLKNQIIAPVEGGKTRVFDNEQFQSSATVSIFEASQCYQASHTPLVVFAGKEYGTGSSRDWAAKGCQLLGIKAVIAQSFERIHRSNLVGMGIMPLQLPSTMSVDDLQLRGDETIDLVFGANHKDKQLSPNQLLQLIIHSESNEPITLPVTLCIHNTLELKYFLAGGVLPYVTSQFL